MKKLTVLAFFLGVQFLSFGQNLEIYLDRVSDKQGLFDQRTQCIIQDKTGFMWIGGVNGLFKYDGYKCTYYKYPPGCTACDPFGRILALQEDSLGNIWVLTRSSLILFDPETEKSSVIYQHHTSSSVQSVFDLMVDQRGNIWCTDTTGLIRISYKVGISKEDIRWNNHTEQSFSLTHFDLSGDVYSMKNNVVEFYEDKEGNIWIGCLDGLYILPKGENHFYDMSGVSKSFGIPSGFYVYNILQYNADTFLIVGNDEYLLRNVKEALHDKKPDWDALVLEKIKYTADQYNELQPTHRWYMDRGGNTLLAAGHGVYLLHGFDKNGGIIYRDLYDNLLDQNGNRIDLESFYLYADRTNLVWSGHQYYGLIKFNISRSNFTSYQNLISRTFTSLDINPIYKDNKENLWIGAYKGGIYKLNPFTSAVKKYDPGYPSNIIITFEDVGNNTFWVGGDLGVQQFNCLTGEYFDRLPDSDNKKILNKSQVWDLLKDGNQLYMGTTNGLFIYDFKTNKLHRFSYLKLTMGSLKGDFFRSPIRLNNGEIWVGNNRHGINRVFFNPEKGEISLVQVIPDSILRKSAVNLEDRFRMFQDSKGLLWLINKRGLYSIDPMAQSIILHNLLEKNEFPEPRSILEDNSTNLWIGTQFGLCNYVRKNGQVIRYTQEDGLPVLLHGYKSAFKDKNGRLYFGGVGGFYSFNPDSIKTNPSIPPVVITEFRLDNIPVKVDPSKQGILDHNIAYTHKIDLTYDQHDIAFTFAVLDYNQPLKNRYAYKLEGYQDEWIETDADNRNATYTNLNPGEYIFRVKGANNDGIWNEEGNFIQINIHPPLWKTTLAYIAYVLLFLFMLRIYIYWRTRRIRKEKMALEKQVADRTTELNTANHQLEEQKQVLMQQKEELQSTLENLQKTQEQLIESEKMAAIGGLVAGVAHEMNTPVGIGITAISNLLDDVVKIAKLYEKDEISRKDFKGFLESAHDTASLIQKNLERAASLIQSFKQVSADQVTEQRRLFLLKEYLHDILLSLRPKFREKKITINIECDNELEINSFPGVFAQIFTNLLLNSVQHGFYKKDTGSISIKAERKQESLKIQYIDDGTGISKKDLPHIFEPFFTTDQHRGTGLGLNIIYNLIRQKLHGSITCDSEPGKGVLFTIEIPVN
jgi:signal transduction histidine kinase/ligand-binding sensor domain-containing protein